MELLRLLPKNHLSFAVGKLMHLKLPLVIGQASVKWFADRFKINMNEAEHGIEHYKTIGELFTRNLKPGIRPIGEGVVHPVDAKITTWGEIKFDTLIQAKGKMYTVTDFLKSASDAKQYEGGYFFTYYLCPTDYHQIHSPVDAAVTKATYIPGRLWPVNDWSVRSIDKLFAINERLVTYLKSEKGTAALVMVGATNVGKMTVSYDKSLVSNQLGFDSNVHSSSEIVNKVYSDPVRLTKGAKLGVFHMGSTVVMLYPKGFLKLKNENPSGPTKLGETLGF